MIVDMTPRCQKDVTYADPARIVYGHSPDPFGRYDDQPELCNPFLFVNNYSEMPFDGVVVFISGSFHRYAYRLSSAVGAYFLRKVATKKVIKSGLSTRGEEDHRITAAYQRWISEGRPEQASFVW